MINTKMSNTKLNSQRNSAQPGTPVTLNVSVSICWTITGQGVSDVTSARIVLRRVMELTFTKDASVGSVLTLVTND